MPRPCLHLHPEREPASCPVCLRLDDPAPLWDAYRAAFGEVPVLRAPAPPPAAADVWLPVAATCRHLGGPTGEQGPCPTCPRATRLNLLACAVHGRCTTETAVDGVACCKGCPDRAALPFPPEGDPLPGPELVPLPRDWALQEATRGRHVAAFRHQLAREWPPPEACSGDGIVTVGGGKFWPGIVVMVRLLREAGCTLPVQVWHRGGGEPVDARQVEGLGVELVDSTRFPARINRGWESKSIALLHCPFERLLYLDADAYCVSDPTPLFALLDQAPFVFWSDLPHTSGNVKWERVGMRDARHRVPTVQGGQLLIHRRAYWRELQLFFWLNQHSEYFYSTGFGDQDLWRVLLATHDAPRSRHLGPAPWVWPAFACGHEGTNYIVHRCQGKLYAPWDAGGQSPPRNDALPSERRVMELFREAVGADARAVFGAVYRSGLWGGGAISGTGSLPAEAGPYLELISGLLALAGAKKVLDLGTGDGQVLRALAARRPVVDFMGIDCHAPHVERLRDEARTIAWLNIDLDAERERLPAADVAVLKDVLHHWPSALIVDWLTWAKRDGRWEWLIVVADRHQDHDGQDCALGGYRGLNPRMRPLAGLGGIDLGGYLHKGVSLFRCNGEH